MHLYALDEQECVVSATKASKQHDYHCRQCGGVVRLRGGLQRQHHFYHLRHERSCSLSGKGLVHLQVQQHIRDLLPKGDVALEHRFPAIARVADVVWMSKKIVFEVQCSSITADDVLCRNHDYQREGYQVVWVLHDDRFNQRCLREAELALRGSPHYFTNIDSQGNGKIYDQFDIIDEGGCRTTIARANPKIECPMASKGKEQQNQCALPKEIRKRLNNNSLFFERDFVDRCLLSSDEDKALITKLLRAEKKQQRHLRRHHRWCRQLFRMVSRAVIFPYRSTFQIFLERACR